MHRSFVGTQVYFQVSNIDIVLHKLVECKVCAVQDIQSLLQGFFAKAAARLAQGWFGTDLVGDGEQELVVAQLEDDGDERIFALQVSMFKGVFDQVDGNERGNE